MEFPRSPMKLFTWIFLLRSKLNGFLQLNTSESRINDPKTTGMIRQDGRLVRGDTNQGNGGTLPKSAMLSNSKSILKTLKVVDQTC